MFLLDLAVPRDIAAEVATLDDVYLYTVDDLEQVIEDNRRSRREAADQAEAIIELQVEHFMAWWRGTQNQDALKRLRADAEHVREQSLVQARQQLAAGRDPQAVLEQLAHGLTNRLLHRPSAALRDAAQRGDIDLLRAGERLFNPDHTREPE
jgi:glutamyl-tRNA reductase